MPVSLISRISQCPCASLLWFLTSPGVCDCFLRSQGGAQRAAGVCSGGGRARAWCAALPRDLYNGAAASRNWVPRLGGSESCVSQLAGCSTRRPPQCCLALWSGRSDHFFLFKPLLTASQVYICLIFLLNCAMTDTTNFLFWSHREESKPFSLAFTTSSAKQIPPSQVRYFPCLIFGLSDPVGFCSCVTSHENNRGHSVCSVPWRFFNWLLTFQLFKNYVYLFLHCRILSFATLHCIFIFIVGKLFERFSLMQL